MPQLLQYQLPNNPLQLLDAYLSSISSGHNAHGNAEGDTNNRDSDQHDTAMISSSTQPPAKHSAQAEQLHNSVLRVAAELFGNNISLLENSLALLEEQEQFQNNPNDDESNNKNNDSPSLGIIIPPIRTIRACKSGRMAVLVRKQRKKSSRTSNQNQQSGKEIIDDYYLCLLGRDRVTIDNNAFKTSKGTYLCTPQHRIGMNCTCRSFFHNIKGSSSSSSSGGGRSKSSGGERSPVRKASSHSSNNNSVVCKHLLAVILMPHLLPWRSQGVEEDVVDDKLFTKLVMRASIG